MDLLNGKVGLFSWTCGSVSMDMWDFGDGIYIRERYKYITAFQGASKKKTIVSIARRLTELMYSILRDKAEYKPRAWTGTQEKTVVLAEKAISA